MKGLPFEVIKSTKDANCQNCGKLIEKGVQKLVYRSPKKWQRTMYAVSKSCCISCLISEVKKIPHYKQLFEDETDREILARHFYNFLREMEVIKMVWTVEKEPNKDLAEELQGIIEQYILWGGDREHQLAELNIERGKIAVFVVHFPLDEDDVQRALSHLRKESKVVEPVFVISRLTFEDTGLPLLQVCTIESKLKDYFLKE